MSKPKVKSSSDLGSAITSLRKAFSLLNAVAGARQPLTIAEASAMAKISRPTGYRIVDALIAEGHLSQDTFGRLHVGFASLPLAAKVLDTNRLRMEALPALQELSKSTGRRSNLGVLYRGRILHIVGAEKPSLPIRYARFGKIVPLHCSAMGKALLAYLPEERVKALIESQGMPRLTPKTLTTYKALAKDLEGVRKNGFAVADEEHVPGLFAVAAMVRGESGPIASIALIGRELEPILATAEKVMHTAEVISHRMDRAD
jgi:IclR family acetate operon transcriptional repressor